MLGGSGFGEDGQANHDIRLYIQMDCSEADGIIAGKLFNEFRKTLIASFPRARIKDRQYDKTYAERSKTAGQDT